MERALTRAEKRVKRHKFYGDPDRKKKLKGLSVNGVRDAFEPYENPYRIPRSKRVKTTTN